MRKFKAVNHKQKKTIMNNQNWKVEVTKMNNADTRVKYFNNFKDAYDYYAGKCEENSIENYEQSTGAEMEMSSGGVGYDYRVELLEDTEAEG